MVDVCIPCSFIVVIKADGLNQMTDDSDMKFARHLQYTRKGLSPGQFLEYILRRSRDYIYIKFTGTVEFIGFVPMSQHSL